jgi:hypothetical protein
MRVLLFTMLMAIIAGGYAQKTIIYNTTRCQLVIGVKGQDDVIIDAISPSTIKVTKTNITITNISDDGKRYVHEYKIMDIDYIIRNSKVEKTIYTVLLLNDDSQLLKNKTPGETYNLHSVISITERKIWHKAYESAESFRYTTYYIY